LKREIVIFIECTSSNFRFIKMLYLYSTSNIILKIGVLLLYILDILWDIDPLLDNYREINREKIQQPLLSNGFATVTEERCFLYGPCRDVISRIVGAMS
jgi:hypothetical protein